MLCFISHLQHPHHAPLITDVQTVVCCLHFESCFPIILYLWCSHFPVSIPSSASCPSTAGTALGSLLSPHHLSHHCHGLLLGNPSLHPGPYDGTLPFISLGGHGTLFSGESKSLPSSPCKQGTNLLPLDLNEDLTLVIAHFPWERTLSMVDR